MQSDVMQCDAMVEDIIYGERLMNIKNMTK